MKRTFMIYVSLFGVLFVHLTQDVSLSSITSTSKNANPFSSENILLSPPSTESPFDEENVSIATLHDISLSNRSINEHHFLREVSILQTSLSLNKTFTNELNNSTARLKTTADNIQNEGMNENNARNSTTSIETDGDLTNSDFFVNNALVNGTTIMNDTSLFLPDKGGNLSPSQNTIHYDFKNESRYVSEISVFEADNQTYFIQTKQELNLSGINESVVLSHVSKETDTHKGKEVKTLKTTKTRYKTSPPPLIVSPPPLPPDEIFQNQAESGKQHNLFEKELTNAKFQPRARKIPEEMRKALLDPNNIVISTGIKHKKVKLELVEEEIFGPELSSPPPPPPILDGKTGKQKNRVNLIAIESVPTEDAHEQQLVSFGGIINADEQSNIPREFLEIANINAAPPPPAKSALHSPSPSKPVMLPPPPPYKTHNQLELQTFGKLPVPPPPPALPQRPKKLTPDTIKEVITSQEKQVSLPPPPPPPPLPPRRTPLPPLPRTLPSPPMTARQRGRINVKTKIPTITKRAQKSSDFYKSLHNINQEKSLAKYLSYFDPDSLYHKSPWSIKSSNSKIANLETVASRPSLGVGLDTYKRVIPSTLKQNVERTSTDPIFKISNDAVTSQSTVKKAATKAGQNEQANNLQVRKMIDTIEKVRTQALSGNIFQFFVPSTVKSKQASTVGTTPRRFETTKENVSKRTEFKIPQTVNSNDSPPILPGLNPRQSYINTQNPWTIGLSRFRRTDRNVSKRMLPIVRIPNYKRNQQLARQKIQEINMVSVKTPMKNDIMLLTNESSKWAFLSTNQGIAASGDVKDSYDWFRDKTINKSKRRNFKVGNKVINLLQNDNVLPTYKKEIHYMQFKDQKPFSTTQAQKSSQNNPVRPKSNSANNNDPPPPIFIQAKHLPIFEIKYVPPPPPVPKYRPPPKQPVQQIYTTTVSPQTTQGNVKETKKIAAVPKRQSRKSSIKKKAAPYKRDMANPEEKCQKCTYVSNFCYLREPSNCNRYILCYKQGSLIRATEKECSFGLFWSESKLACIQASRADCVTDPCRTPGVRSHPYIGKCRAYWTCRRRRSDARCCPKGYAFDEIGKACVPKADCLTECQTETFVADNVCHLKEVSSSPFKYYDDGMLRLCAPGTRFKQSVCTCVRSSIENKVIDAISNKEVHSFQCKPDIKLDFSGKTYEAFDDKSGNTQSLGVNDVVQTLKEQAMFNGRGNLVLWRFSNVELGPELAVKFKFYAHGQSLRSETLFSNCIGRKDVAAIDIRLETDILEIIFNVKTTKSPETHMRMFYRPFQWNDVILRYDGSSLSAAIGEVSKTVYVEGVIPTKHAAISIGGCGKDDGFIGYMDDIIIFNECIPEDVSDLVFE